MCHRTNRYSKVAMSKPVHCQSKKQQSLPRPAEVWQFLAYADELSIDPYRSVEGKMQILRKMEDVIIAWSSSLEHWSLMDCWVSESFE